jgi:dihydroorotate dehydrogenase
MTGWYERAVYSALVRLDAERAHRLALRGLSVFDRVPGGCQLLRWLCDPPADDRLAVDCLGRRFPNPLGLAAGFDKDAEAVGALLALGFGFVEVGTVTPRPQPGNPRPRLWRLPEERALVNALGFPSAGMAAVRARLAGRRFSGVIGINLGKNRETPLERAAEDYVAVLAALWDVADYLVVNVSSPNTPGLRELQARAALVDLLRALGEENRRLARLRQLRPRPLLVKIAPDLDLSGLEQVVEAALEGGAQGLVIANTSTDRRLLCCSVPDLPGGISGRPLRARATDLTREAYRLAGDRLAIIGVGGIGLAEDTIERLRAGASLVQLYTAFVYEGPALPARILRGLLAYLEREGLRSVEQLVGVDA